MSDHHIPEGAEEWKNKILRVGYVLVFVALVYQLQESGVIKLNLPTSSPNTVGIYYPVTRVTDGDTLHVDIEGTDETVRLIGINTPETVDPRRPVECFGKEASNRMKELAKGEIVKLEYDETQSTRDAYGRLLAYVYLEDGEMLNRKMIAEGYAYEYTYMLPYRYQKEFRELQTLAKTSKRGLWSDETCSGSKDLQKAL
jgi:micrococcal nuclease